MKLKYFFKFCKFCFFVSIVLFSSVFSSSLAESQESEKLAVLYSQENVKEYERNKINFISFWDKFVKVLDEAKIPQQYITNIDSTFHLDKLSSNTILFPFAATISSDEAKFLEEFLASGGKLIVLSGNINISDRLKEFLVKNQIQPYSISEPIKKSIKVSLKDNSSAFELPIGSIYSQFKITDSLQILGKYENSDLAIAQSNNILFCGFTPVSDEDSDLDSRFVSETLKTVGSNVTPVQNIKISKEEFYEILDSVKSVEKRAVEVVNAKEFPNDLYDGMGIHEHFEKAEIYFNEFKNSYQIGDYVKALESAERAKEEFFIVSAFGLPVVDSEIRAIWLDRGTIVGFSGPDDLKDYIKTLAQAGFNIIFFETINAGFPIYPSKLLPQNPLIKDWDPLAVAVKAAHDNGIELHAWVWTFSAGNEKHNIVVGLPKDFPGPILTKNPTWALKTNTNEFMIGDQPEFWVSPANKEATDFLLTVFSEIVSNYDVDGLQLDYIRFPFQRKNIQYGFDEVSKNQFRAKTGLEPSIHGHANRAWKEWKIGKVSSFVERTNSELKKIKPNLKLSVGVFGIQRHKRLNNIQQDWEYWAQKKWVDLVCPFYYSYSPSVFQQKFLEQKDLAKNRAIIIPGFNLRTLTPSELSQRLIATRNSGALGITFFSSSHLNRDRLEILIKGPFRKRASSLPYVNTSTNLVKAYDDFSRLIDEYTDVKGQSILTDKETNYEVLALTNKLKNQIHSESTLNIEDVNNQLDVLNLKIQSWLRFEKYLGRTDRVASIQSSLERIKGFLGYIN